MMTRAEAKAILRREFPVHYVMVQIEDSYHDFDQSNRISFAVFVQPGFVGDGNSKCSMARANTLDAAVNDLLNQRDKFAAQQARPNIPDAEADALFAVAESEIEAALVEAGA